MENDRELSDRFGLSIKTVRRMRRDIGGVSPAATVRRDLPDDFRDHAHLSNVALARHYGVGEKIIRRFRVEYKAMLDLDVT